MTHAAPNTDFEARSNPASWRLAILLPAGIAMLLGLNAGLLLLGVAAPLDFGPAERSHGILMTLGFIGALIVLERAVAHGAWWAFAAPVLLALGAITGVVPFFLEPAPRILLLLGSSLALIMYIPLWRRNQDPSVAVQALGMALAVGAAMQWGTGQEVAAFTPWLLSFLVLTIAGERMELSRIMIQMRGVKARDAEALAVCLALAVATLASSFIPTWGPVLYGVALVLVAVRFAVRDVARFTVKSTGLPHFSAACMLIGYAWLVVGGVLWALFGLTVTGYDSAVHAVTIGFVMSMILAHASIILPAVLRRALPYTPWFWLPLALFQVGLAVRVVGNLAGLTGAYRVGGVLTTVAMLVFVLTAVTSAVTAAVRASRRTKQAEAEALAKESTGGSDARPLTSPGSVGAGTAAMAGSAAAGSQGGSAAGSDGGMRARARMSRVVAGVGALALIGAISLAATNAKSLSEFTAAGGSSAGAQGGAGAVAAPGAASVQPTGRTTTIELSMGDMLFDPAQISVPAGDELVLVVTNNDGAGQLHDLSIPTDAGEISTGRLAPGESATLNVGVVTQNITGICTVAGHLQEGMQLHIVAEGAPRNGADTAVAGSTGNGEASVGQGSVGTDHATTEGTASGAGQAGELTPSDWKTTPFANDFEARDATAPAAVGEPGEVQTHRLEMRVSEMTSEVAPGVTQEVWTFNGTAPGPVLRGRVGDRFEITFINDGTIGHGIDFHSSALAPDKPMRTIEPGERLTYTFTAKMAGFFTYHCSAKPMSTHIANGMFGAVLIEPAEGLPEVDREFTLAQSEQYHGADGEAGNAAKIKAEQPDAVVFNGYPNQYVQRPLEVKVGERVRIWVTPVGPSRDLDFHIVGGQFDTVWREGAYTVVCGHEPWSPSGASAVGSGCSEDSRGQFGAQTVHFGVTEGGFVELEFHEAGTYTFVNHQMSAMESGAMGYIRVNE